MKNTDIDLGTITSILWEIFQVKQTPLTKSDLYNHPGLPSYNTCMRRWLRLNKLNSEFVQKVYYENPKLCKCCEAIIPYERKINEFCGHSCSATFSNTGRVRIRKEEDFDVSKARKKRYKVIKQAQGVKSIVVKTTFCINCDIEMAEGAGGNRKYCSLQCQQDFNFEQRFRDWFEFGKHFDNKPIRTFLKVWKGYYCEHCGISDWNGKEITLEVEHIDGNSDNSFPENVCFLCPNCHSQTPTYKARNIGNGRHWRKMRYREGKSY